MKTVISKDGTPIAFDRSGKVLFVLSVLRDGFIAAKNDDVSLVFAWFARAWERLYEAAGDVLGKTGAVIMGLEMLSSRLTMSRVGLS
jgi:hypothetical protein